MGTGPVIDGCIYGNRPAAGSAPQPHVAASRSHSSHPDATWLLAARNTCSAGLGQCPIGSYRHRSLAARCARLVDFLVVSIGVRNLLRGLFLAVSTLSVSIAHLRRRAERLGLDRISRLPRKVHGGCNESLLRPTIKSPSFVSICEGFIRGQHTGDSVGQLDFPAGTPRYRSQVLEYRRFEHVATYYCERRWCLFGRRLFDDVRHFGR